MRPRLMLMMIGTLLLAACGTTHKTTVVAAPEGSTVVVPNSGDAHVVKP